MSRTAITTALAALAMGLGAAPALAAEIGPQQTIAKAGQKSPLTVGGTGIKKGSTLKPGQTLIKRTAVLEGRERSSMVLTCARGSALQGLASEEAGKFTWVTASRASYVGKRAAGVNLFGKAAPGVETKAEMYAICRKA